MQIYFLPRTLLGKCSIGLIVGLVIFFAVAGLVVASGQQGGETFFSNLAISVPMFLAGISGISAFFTGVVSIIKSKERSVFVFFTTFMGLLVISFLSGEFLSFDY
jgi:hypothetical protein